LPARIAAAEQCRCGNREPVEFSPFAGGGGRHCHRCPRAVHAKRRASQEIGDTAAGERTRPSATAAAAVRA